MLTNELAAPSMLTALPEMPPATNAAPPESVPSKLPVLSCAVAPLISSNVQWATRLGCARVGRLMRTILLLILIILLIGALPTWPYSTGWGYYPSGGFGLILLILLILALMGKL